MTWDEEMRHEFFVLLQMPQENERFNEGEQVWGARVWELSQEIRALHYPFLVHTAQHVLPSTTGTSE